MILGILSGDDQGLAQFFSIDATPSGRPVSSDSAWLLPKAASKPSRELSRTTCSSNSLVAGERGRWSAFGHGNDSATLRKTVRKLSRANALKKSHVHKRNLSFAHRLSMQSKRQSPMIALPRPESDKLLPLLVNFGSGRT